MFLLVIFQIFGFILLWSRTFMFVIYQIFSCIFDRAASQWCLKSIWKMHFKISEVQRCICHALGLSPFLFLTFMIVKIQIFWFKHFYSLAVLARAKWFELSWKVAGFAFAFLLHYKWSKSHFLCNLLLRKYRFCWFKWLKGAGGSTTLVGANKGKVVLV